MYKIELPNDTPIDNEFIKHCIQENNNNKLRFEKLDSYYANDNKINSNIPIDETLPNNKLSHNFSKYISTLSTAYFMGNGVKYDCNNKDYMSEIENVLLDNYFDSQNYEEAKEMSKKGISFELLYINTDGKLKTKFLNASSVISVYSSDIESFLNCALYLYEIKNIDNTLRQYVDVFTKNEIVSFTLQRNGSWVQTERKYHGFSDVPVIIRRNNEEAKGDYEDVVTLIDAYDRSQSDTLNDLDYFTDAYLIIKGAEEIVNEVPDNEGIITQKPNKCMKQRRTLYLPEGGEASFLIKNINDTATENFKNRVYKDIFFLAMVPNLTDENFSGNLSGVAQKYKLFGLEALTDEKEKYWKSAERKKLKFITQYINILKSTNYDWHTINVSFDRSQIANTLEISEIMNNLRGILSNETIVGMYPEVDSVSDELERIKTEQEQSENTSIPEDIY